MHGLQPVARVRQRAPHDRRERVGKVALLKRLCSSTISMSSPLRPGESRVFPCFTAISRICPEQAGSGRLTRECGNKRRARLRQSKPARLKHMAGEEEFGEREAGGDIAKARLLVIAAKKSGKRQQPILPRLARLLLTALPISARHKRGRNSSPLAAQLERSRPKPSSPSSASSKRTIRRPGQGSSR